MQLRLSECAACHLSCTTLHPLKVPAAFADLADVPVGVHGAVAIGEGAQAGAGPLGLGEVAVVAGGAVVFAFAAIGSYLNRASASAGALSFSVGRWPRHVREQEEGIEGCPLCPQKQTCSSSA